jgi:hypothetical protein
MKSEMKRGRAHKSRLQKAAREKQSVVVGDVVGGVGVGVGGTLALSAAAAAMRCGGLWGLSDAWR